MKKACILILGSSLLFSWNCVTYRPIAPDFYIEGLPPAETADLSLDERILIEEVWTSLREGDIPRARKKLEELGAENPFYYVGWGYSSYALQEFNEAESYFKAVLDARPDSILSRLGLAQIYEDLGRMEDAFVQYREILKVDSEHPWAKPRYEALKDEKTRDLLKQAEVRRKARDLEKSKEIYLQALYYSPDSREAHLSLAEILREEGDYQGASVHLKSVWETSPEDLKTAKLYAQTLVQAENYRAALTIYEELAADDPQDREIKKSLEMVKNRLGIFELPRQYDAIPAAEAVTKEQMAALLSVKFRDILDHPEGRPPIIIDIATSWAAKNILRITSLGLLDIYPNHTFQPQKVISRAEMAEILVRLIEQLKRQGRRFIPHIPLSKIEVTDVSFDNYYHQPIIKILSYDIMSLSEEKSFMPDRPVSGREAVKYLDIILALL